MSLKIIDLSRNLISESIDCFSCVINLEESNYLNKKKTFLIYLIYRLNLSHNKIIETEVLKELSGCNIKRINLIGNKVSK